MMLRLALLAVVAVLSGCVSSGYVDPMKTSEGREKARDAYIDLGIGYLERGMTEKAKGPLKQALDIDSSSANAHMALALAFQMEMEADLADKHYRRAISIDGDNARLLNNYGSFLFEQERYSDAYGLFQKASADTMYSERSRVFENLGLTALKLNQRDQAKTYFTRSLRLNSQQPRALLEMAWLSYEDQEFVPARGYYQAYEQISQPNARSLLLGIKLATVFQDRSKAATLGLQLKRLYPGTAEYQQYISEQ